MERADSFDGIVLLLDDYSDESKKLHKSFKLSGIESTVIVINDDGFVPDDVISVYNVLLGDFGMPASDIPGKPRYFNQIDVPEFWEISGNNSSGSVHDMGKERARIYYAEPKNKRLVRLVEWLNEQGTVRVGDHYNKYGALYARTIFNAKGERVNKSFFSPDGKEIIVENYVTGSIVYRDGDCDRIFANRTDFIIYVLERLGLSQCRLLYNSLSYPFFVSEKKEENHRGDILFWQENRRDDIPGNMQIILSYRAKRTGKIYVQKKAAYEKLIELGASPNIVKLMGNVYDFAKDNNGGKDVLICTNSDQIAKLDELVEALPQLHFHIAALTEMSSQLLSRDSYDNVSLYPGIKSTKLDELFMKCDYYLDINRYDEIVDAVSTAFLHNQLILAFDETVHNRNYVCESNIYKCEDWKAMAEKLTLAFDSAQTRERLMAEQRKEALAEEGIGFCDKLGLIRG